MDMAWKRILHITSEELTAMLQDTLPIFKYLNIICLYSVIEMYLGGPYKLVVLFINQSSPFSYH